MAEEKACVDYEVRFLGGPYDGRVGTLPFLPEFMTLHEMGGLRDPAETGFVLDTRIFSTVYLLTQPTGEDGPYLYVHRTDIDLGEWLDPPSLKELDPGE